jgi:hypothetical protein
MTLKEKIEYSKTCIHEVTNSGRCRLDGYAPFDCEKCTSYKKRDKIYKCCICGINSVDAEDGYDTCDTCLTKI